MTLGLINANPVVHAKKERIARSEDPHAILDFALTNFVRDIRDPEHPYSLEQLSVLSEESITVDDKLGRILITFTPTVQHCSMATVIGLCLRVKLKHYFPPHYKVDIKVSPGSHADEESVNKQLNDKERVAAALENPNLRQLVDECLYSNELKMDFIFRDVRLLNDRNSTNFGTKQKITDQKSRLMEFSRSFRLSKSHRIPFSSEYVTSECGYERISQSVRLSGEHDFSEKYKKNKRGAGLLGKVFSFARISSPQEEPNKVAERVVKKEKKRSSWLPDPDKRWPIQGW
ncbi:hypothetical protein DEO72_LG4g1986 [Vigna unguiculata]|uniref:Uncharacterized protein n=1 Tax=Vigna unguiculata TaxID=3917 RepID=A0A4D6LSR6_VIGUN|nr:hypothetical protein DEO72_LG4g1986 [Vigna unguiculata]